MWVAGAIAAFSAACAKDNAESVTKNCAPDQLPDHAAAATGVGRVFKLDPMVSSDRLDVFPGSVRLDDFAVSVGLERLGGHGVLEGQFVDVRNGTGCDGWFGAYETGNAFSYPHSDARFQETMSYHWGDRFRLGLSEAGYLQPLSPVTVVAHCRKEDNAFFVRGRDSAGNRVQMVCLGDSVATPGASYADDASVIVHELQHATTTDTYSFTERLNQFWYDEAGSLNEAVSDFMSMVFEAPLLSPRFDAKLFSRWALATFIPKQAGARGAHKCPRYDSSFATGCASYPAFSGTDNHVSYVYPDGLGWPYSNNFQGPGFVADAFATYKSQEEIHNAGVVLEGALWDVYDALKANHGGDAAQAQVLSTKLVMEAVKHLPKPTAGDRSPVTFRGLADLMVSFGPSIGLSGADQASVLAALTARGLQGGASLDATWGAVGPGNAAASPGVRIQDNPAMLKTWLIQMTENLNAGALVPQGIATGLNSQLDPGELVAIWFDLRNTAAQTAGGIRLTVTALDPEVTFEPSLNVAPLDDAGAVAQIQYGKVNGTAVVAALASANATFNVATGNSYFRTNPFFDRNWTTALWVRVARTAAHGKTVRFRVQAKPSNGAESTVEFTALIN